MELGFDLNYPHAEESSASVLPLVPSPESNPGKFGYPIDVDLSDDDIQILSSPPPFFQCRKRSRKNHQVTAILEGDLERIPAEQGSAVDEPAAILSSLGGSHNSDRVSLYQRPCPPLLVFNLGARSTVIEENDDNVMPAPPVSALPPFLPSPPRTDLTFNCPVCLDTLSNPCSTRCGHIFCEKCIDASIKASVRQKKGRLCPNCRAKLPTRNSFHRVYLPNTN